MPKKLMFACAMLLCLSLLLYSRSQQVDPSGIYLADGIVGCLEIKKKPLGYSVEFLNYGSPFDFGPEFTVAFKSGILKVTSVSGADPSSQSQQIWTLEPSKAIPGDWDLIEQEFISGITEFDFLLDGKREVKVPSYFHKVNDQWVKHYHNIAAAGEGEFTKAAEQLIQNHPDDLWIRLLLFDSLMRNKQHKMLEDQLAIWDEAYENCGKPHLLIWYRWAKRMVYAHQLSAEGKNAHDIIEQLLSSNYEQQMAQLPQLLNYRECLPALSCLLYDNSANFLGIQILAKTTRPAAINLLLQGKRAEALKLCAASFQLGQLMSQGGAINAYLGPMMGRPGQGALELHVLNACTTAKELEQCWEIINELNKLNIEPDFEQLKQEEAQVNALISMERTKIYYLVGQAKMQLLRMAVAARHFQLTHGYLPFAEQDFVKFYPDGLPQDPFSSGTMKLMRKDDALFLYSVGLNGIDDQASMPDDSWEAINPMYSGEEKPIDIVIKVTKERQYPFPKEPLKADSVEDVFKLFPNGLPPDLFASVRGTPMGVADTSPVKVYSFGPDRDQNQAFSKGSISDYTAQEASEAAKYYHPEVHYDPTNGVTSEGDIFFAIPPKIKK